MLIGYMRVSKADGSQSTDLQRDALRAAGITTRRLYEDRASGRHQVPAESLTLVEFSDCSLPIIGSIVCRDLALSAQIEH